MAGKHVSESYTEQVQILSQSTLNGYNRLFGGQLMQWIDVVAGGGAEPAGVPPLYLCGPLGPVGRAAVVARRHSGCNVTTASVDNLRFEGPAYANDTIVLCGYITYTGRTSMEVCVRTYVEELSGLKRLINVAYLVMVALNAEERPTEVPKLVVESEAEKREWEAACERNAIRKTRRKAAQKELKG